MPKFKCNRYTIDADSIGEAAGTIAEKYARKHFGARATVRMLRENTWTEDGHYSEFQAFVGRYDPVWRNVSGHDWYFTVSRGGE